MKKLLVIFLSLIACLSCVSKEEKKEGPMIVGGYAPADLDGEYVKECVELLKAACQEKYAGKVFTLDSAEVQVVAGLNYKIAFHLGEKDSIIRGQAVIYRNLEKTYKITSLNFIEGELPK